MTSPFRPGTMYVEDRSWTRSGLVGQRPFPPPADPKSRLPAGRYSPWALAAKTRLDARAMVAMCSTSHRRERRFVSSPRLCSRSRMSRDRITSSATSPRAVHSRSRAAGRALAPRVAGADRGRCDEPGPARRPRALRPDGTEARRRLSAAALRLPSLRRERPPAPLDRLPLAYSSFQVADDLAAAGAAAARSLRAARFSEP